MTSGAMSGCDFLTIPQVQHSEDNRVWRYVMEAGFGAEGVLDISCLEILEKDNGYLSFYHSDRMPKWGLRANGTKTYVNEIIRCLYLNLELSALLLKYPLAV